ncbi:MAG: methyl-accepting chemotaxis protein [Halothece sp.]
MVFNHFSQGSLSRVKLLTLPLALTVSLIGGVGWQVWDSYQRLQQFYSQDIRIVELSRKIDYLDEALTMSARMAAVTGNQEWVERYNQFDSQLWVVLEEVTELIPSLFEGAANNELNDVSTKLLNLEKEAFGFVQQGDLESAETILFGQEYENEKRRYVDIMSEITTAMRDYTQESVEAQTQKTRIALLMIAVTLATLILVWGVVLRMLINSVQAVRNASNSLSSVSSQITATVIEEEALAASQLVAVTQTSTTMNELGDSAQQSAQQVEAALTEAQEALNIANSGKEVVEETLSSMKLLQQKVEIITQQILDLSDQTGQIGNISTLVSELANQTNLLALNAAVEAVRAGESGKGFGVVAAEIRKLADQSKMSAQKIANLVDRIQDAIRSTTTTTEEGNNTVHTGMALTEKTAMTFNDVVEAINNITLNSHQIALTAKQQAVAIEQVAAAMTSLNQGTAQTTTAISQTKVATQQLNETTEILTKLV